MTPQLVVRCVSVPPTFHGEGTSYYLTCDCGWASGPMGAPPIRKICLACEERQSGEAHFADLCRAIQRAGSMHVEDGIPPLDQPAPMVLVVGRHV